MDIRRRPRGATAAALYNNARSSGLELCSINLNITE